MFWKMSQKISVQSEENDGPSKYSRGKGHHYKGTHCCDAVGNVVFTAGTEELTFWEKKLAEWTWGRGLFCLRCVWSPGGIITCRLQTFHPMECGKQKVLSGKSSLFTGSDPSQLFGSQGPDPRKCTGAWPGPAGFPSTSMLHRQASLSPQCVVGVVSTGCFPSA